MSRLPLTRVYISLKNLDHNLSLLRELAGGRPLWPAIKADAYGHGARIVASHLVSRGVDTFGVAQVQEALELAENGIDARFIILSPDLGDTAQEIAAHGFEPVVATDIQLRALSREALRQGRDIRVHLKFDTGMGRVGFCPREADTVLARIAGYPGLKIAGFMSHFPRADEGDPEYSLEQLGRFRDLVEKTADFRDFETHMANSAAIFDVSGACFDACRPGIALYGLKPSSEIRNPRVDELKPVLSWKTAINPVKGGSPRHRVELRSQLCYLPSVPDSHGACGVWGRTGTALEQPNRDARRRPALPAGGNDLHGPVPYRCKPFKGQGRGR